VVREQGSAEVNRETRSRWRFSNARHVIAAVVVVAAVEVVLFVGVLGRGTDGLRRVAFMPTSVPSGLEHLGGADSSGDGIVQREEHFGWQAGPPTSAGPGQHEHGHDGHEHMHTHGPAAAPDRNAMIVTTSTYTVGRVDPDLEGRLSGEVYETVEVKPQARRVMVRGRDGVLEVFPPRRNEGIQHETQTLVLTWIERPGVYVTILGDDLSEQQLLETANSLREQ
jgi:hypothetical protein